MDCAEARPLLSARLDGALTPAERAALDGHLAGCAACRALGRELAAEGRLLAELWPPVTAPAGFAGRVAAALPPRPAAPPRPAPRRPFVLAAALLLALLASAVLSQGPARASLGLFLRQAVLRESPPPTAPPQVLPLRRVSLEEAQALASWPIRRPDPPPEGYRLVEVYAGEIHLFAAGPTVVLHYRQGDGAGARHLGITQLRVADGDRAPEPVAPGAARSIPVGAGAGLVIDGRWVERDGGRAWERGTLVRLIVEDGDLLLQLQADPRDGWDAERLAAVAAALR